MSKECLIVLDLGGNHISYKGCEYLCKFLEYQLCSLRSLMLNNNAIRDHGIWNLVKGLVKNQSLTYLDLNYNGLTDEGMEDIARMMANNKHLIFLNIFWN